MIRNIVVTILLFSAVTIMAQRTNSSPYSYFGIGDEFRPSTVEQSSMGNIGVAFSHYKYLNFTNPAAFADLRYATYTLGLLNNDLTVKSQVSSQNSVSTNLSYIALGIPIGKTAGFSLGMQPVSSVGYSLTNTITGADGEISEATFYEGNGGVNRIYGSFGIKVWKGLSLGVEGDFSFGNVENGVANQRAGLALATKYKEIINVRGSSVKFGAQYKTDLKDKLSLTAGATVKLGNDVSIKGDEYLYSLNFSSSGSEFPRDTISSTKIDGKFNFPIKYTAGVGVGEFDKWYAGVEYEMQESIGANGLLASANGAYRYGKSDRISVGGFFLPKINSISSYWERVTYRGGFRYENSGLLLDGSGNNTNFTEIKDFGISFGLGLPLKRLSTVNLGFEFGKRGTTSNNLLEENYFKFRLSLSLTDINWFVKRQID